MPALGIRSIPKVLYKMLKERAKAEQRSLNQEVIWLLKEGLMGSVAEVESVWANIDKRRTQLASSGKNFSDSVKLLRKDRSR